MDNMINRILSLFNNNYLLIKDNFMIFIAFNLANLIGFLFQFYMGRVLGPSDYGILGTLISMIYLFNVFILAIQTSITKFVSDLKVKKEYNKIAYLLVRSLKKLFVVSLIIIMSLIIISPLVTDFLHIDKTPFIIITFFILFAGIIPVTRGILQGLQRFTSYGFNYLIESLLKLLIAISLVYFGLRVNAGTLAFVLSSMFAFLFSLIPLRKFFVIAKEKFNTKNIYSYSFPVGFTLLVLTSLYTVDIILVKHFLDPINAGLYAAMALIGKAVFFGTFSIGQVMFSKASELYYQNEHSKSVLYKSLLFICIAAIPVIILFYIFSDLIINISYGTDYIGISNLIWLYSLVILLFTLTYTISLYNLAIGKTKFIYLLVLFNFIEISLIWIFHNTILEVITVLLYLFIVLFILSLFIVGVSKDVRSNIGNSSL
ncbi:oligosaccharide flippase family protein [Candidatus Woesearchaeota archaeon]|nr:oligosaccharide flippase family protein [Candidatus Woesearchaeota archaeon]